MSQTLADHPSRIKRDSHSDRLKRVSDAAAEIYRLHSNGKISSEEAARRLLELKTKNRTFLDRLVG